MELWFDASLRITDGIDNKFEPGGIGFASEFAPVHMGRRRDFQQRRTAFTSKCRESSKSHAHPACYGE
jgi:hypothetical protein